MKLNIGVDLHKTQFTTCMLSEDRMIIKFDEYPTKDEGYEAFIGKLNFLIENGYEFQQQMNQLGIPGTS